MLDNIDIAVMTKLNDLAARHGLEPYDFVAVFRPEDEAGGRPRYALEFEVPATGNALREERFGRMLADLGAADGDRATVIGSCQRVIEALNTALARAPRPKGRF